MTTNTKRSTNMKKAALILAVAVIGAAAQALQTLTEGGL